MRPAVIFTDLFMFALFGGNFGFRFSIWCRKRLGSRHFFALIDNETVTLEIWFREDSFFQQQRGHGLGDAAQGLLAAPDFREGGGITVTKRTMSDQDSGAYG